MSPPPAENTPPLAEFDALEFEIAVKDLDARHQEQMADAKWPETLELMKRYILDRFDLSLKSLRPLSESSEFERALEFLKEKHIQYLADTLKNVRPDQKQDILSSIGLKISARISRQIAQLRREALAKATKSASRALDEEHAHVDDPGLDVESRTSAPKDPTITLRGARTLTVETGGANVSVEPEHSAPAPSEDVAALGGLAPNTKDASSARPHGARGEDLATAMAGTSSAAELKLAEAGTPDPEVTGSPLPIPTLANSSKVDTKKAPTPAASSSETGELGGVPVDSMRPSAESAEQLAARRCRWLDTKVEGRFSDVQLSQTKKVSYNTLAKWRRGEKVRTTTRRGISDALNELGISCEFSEVPE